MTTEKAHITSAQLFTLIFVSRLSLIFLYSAAVSGRETIWELLLPVIISLPLMLLLLLPAFVLLRTGKSALHLPVSSYSASVSGKTIRLLYGGYFIYSALYSLTALLGFMSSTVPEGVEPKLIIALLITGCVYAAVRGIEAAARMSVPVAVLIVISLAVSLFLLLPGFHANELVSARGLSFSTVTDGIVFLFSRMDCLAAVHPLEANTRGKICRSMKLFLLFTTLFMVFMLIVLQGADGDYLKARDLQVYSGLEGSGSLQRIDPLFILVIVCSFFCELSLLLICAVSCLQPVFRKTPVKRLSLICGAMLLLAVLFLDSSMTTIICNRFFKAAVNLVFLTILPLTVLVCNKAAVRKLKGKRLFRYTAMLLCLPLIMLSFTGCSSIQLSQRIMIQGIGVDKYEDGCKLTVIALDTDDTSNDNSSRLFYSEGHTPEQAMSELENRSGKRALFSQCLFIMMNAEAGADSKTLEYFSQLRDIRMSVNLMISESSAENTLYNASEKYSYTAESINTISDSKAIDQPEVHCSLMEYLSASNSGNNTILLPFIVEDNSIRAVRTDGSYVIDRETNSFYRLTDYETKGALMLSNKLRSCTGIAGNKSFIIESQVTKVVPYYDNGQLTFYVSSSVGPLMTDGDEYSSVCELFRDRISACLEKTLHVHGSDILSLKKQFFSIYRKASPEVQDFSQLLRRSIFHVNVTAES